MLPICGETAEYHNLAAIAFYQSFGVVFIAEEDPASESPEKYYAVVMPNPNPPLEKPLSKTFSAPRTRKEAERKPVH